MPLRNSVLKTDNANVSERKYKQWDIETDRAMLREQEN